MTALTSTQRKRKRSSICSSSNESEMASDLKSESEWDAGSLVLSSSRESTGAADATSATTGTTTTTTTPTTSSKVSTAQLPELPKIGDLVLEVFTHRTLRIEGSVVSNAFSDNERLSEVGEMALNLAVTNYLYHKQPVIESTGIPVSIMYSDSLVCMFMIHSIKAERCAILSNENYETWIKHYDIQKQLRYNVKMPVDLNAPQVYTFRLLVLNLIPLT